jgi:uncharacterized membrane protein YedE/YeeE
MQGFTPIPSLAGGILIGLAASLFFLSHGRVAGISGLVGGLLKRPDADTPLRFSFLAGLVAVGGLGAVLRPEYFSAPTASAGVLVFAGLLVGWGTRLGNGCTSGHGVCGISRFSVRSLVATGTFITAGAVAVAAARLVRGLP